MLFKVSISWCIITRSSEDEGSNDVKGTLKVFATRHLSTLPTFKVSGCRQFPLFLSIPPTTAATRCHKAKMKPRAVDGLKVGEDICVIWNDATFQLFQINGLILLVQHWSSYGLIKGDRISGKKWKLRDGVKDLHLPGSRHWLWDVQCGTSPCKHYHPNIIPM